MSPIVQTPLAQLSWYHHRALIAKLGSPEDRLWYATKSVEHGWSRNVLALQIEAGLHKREGKALTHFKATLRNSCWSWARGLRSSAARCISKWATRTSISTCCSTT